MTPPFLSVQIELDDAQVAAVEVSGTTVTLLLPAVPAQQAGSGADGRPVPGYLGGVRITLDGAQLQCGEGCVLADCIGAVRQGRLTVDGQALRTLPVPADWNGATVLALEWHNGAALHIRATRVRLSAPANGFRESFAC